MSRSGGLGRLGGVRVRATLAAVVVVAVVLAAAAAAFVVLQRRQLEGELVAVAEQQAADVATQVAAEGVSAADVGFAGRGRGGLVQVVDARGVVVAADPALAGAAPVVDLLPPPGRTEARRVSLPALEDEPFVVVARGVETPAGYVAVLSAQSLETVERATAVLLGLLAVGYPALLLVVGATSYWLTGMALSPVEAMRRRVAGITATDLTARVPVPGTHDEIATLATTMNAMLDRLEAAAQAQRRFVADASHELRSPLASIRAAHEVAAVHPEEADWTAVGDDVLAETGRLDRLVGDLLLLARSDEHGLDLHHEDVDLDDLVAAEAARLRRTTALSVTVHAPPVRVVGDRHHLARALRNLVDNAARYAATRVDLAVARSGDEALLTVADDGPGIPEADRERVFERFVRLDESRDRAGGGTGLGLPIARQVAREHGGDLTVEASDHGARLCLRLPLTPR